MEDFVPRGGDEDEQQQEQPQGEDEDAEKKKKEEEEKQAKKRIIRNPMPKLNPERITGPRGIGKIRDLFKDFKPKGTCRSFFVLFFSMFSYRVRFRTRVFRFGRGDEAAGALVSPVVPQVAVRGRDGPDRGAREEDGCQHVRQKDEVRDGGRWGLCGQPGGGRGGR